jgi:hypothetical protein
MTTKVTTETKQDQINYGYQNSFRSTGIEGAPAERNFLPGANDTIR